MWMKKKELMKVFEWTLPSRKFIKFRIVQEQFQFVPLVSWNMMKNKASTS